MLSELDEVEFGNFLKRKGKKQNVIERNIQGVNAFTEFLEKERGKKLTDVSKEDIIAYIETIELKKQSAKGSLYILMNFFKFSNNEEMLEISRALHEERTKKTRRIFPLKGLLDIEQEHVKKLATIGIKNVEEMLKAGKTKNQREALANQLEIPEEAILELVKLSDITRLGYVRAKLSRLYYNAGLDSPMKVAEFEAQELYDFFSKYVKESGWDGMIPNLSDLKYNIANARKLEKFVEE